MKVRFSPPKLQRNVTVLVIRALMPIGFVTSVTGKAENLRRGGGRGGAGGDHKPYQYDQEALKMLPRCLERQRGMVSREHWGESLPESVRVIKENKSWWACFRLSDSGEWHFPLSERLVQDKSWWANKMIEQKELFYKDRTSVPEPIFCSLVSS